MPAELVIGSQLGGYRIEERVSRGGMGVVYRATELALDRTIALKLIAPELAEDQRFRERFLRESKLAASIEHPNILPIHAAGEADGSFYIAMRYVEGVDLRTLLEREGTLAPDRVLAIVTPIADALDAAHELGLVHRDVKPGNILLDRGGHAYLCDFGLTKQVTSISGLTATGQIVGTLDYMAPEQIRGDPIDGRADQYSLACVLYECVAGEPPHKRENDAQVLWAHMHASPRPLEDLRLDAVVRKALAKEPRQRYSSCVELVSAARATLGALPLARRRRRAALAGAVALAVILIAVAAAVLRGGSGGKVVAAVQVVPESVAAIDPKTMQVVADVPLTGAGYRLAVGEGALWVTIPDQGFISRIEFASRRVTRTYGAGLVPSDLAVGGGVVWVLDSTAGTLRPLDPRYEELGAVIRIPRGRFTNLLRSGYRSFTHPDPTRVAAGEGAIWVVHASGVLVRVDSTTRKLTTLPLGPNIDGVAVGDGYVWATRGAPPAVLKIDPRRLRVVAAIPIARRGGPLAPFPLGVAAGHGAVWVTNANTNTISRIDPQAEGVVATLPTGLNATRPAVSADAVWLAGESDGSVLRIDTATNQATTIQLAGGLNPADVAVGDGLVWVAIGRND